MFVKGGVEKREEKIDEAFKEASVFKSVDVE